MKFRTINKLYGKLKMKCFEMPNATYTNRSTLKLINMIRTNILTIFSIALVIVSCNQIDKPTNSNGDSLSDAEKSVTSSSNESMGRCK